MSNTYKLQKSLIISFLTALVLMITPTIVKANITDSVNKPISISTDCQAWSWWSEPRSISWKGGVLLGSVRCPDGKIVVTWIKDGITSSRVIGAALNGFDDHNNPVFFVWPNGKLQVFWTGHNSTSKYLYTRTTKDFVNWNKTIKFRPDNKKYTYQHPIYTNGRLYLFFRGSNLRPKFTSSIDGIHWTKAITLMRSVKNAGYKYRDNRPYVKYALAPNGRVGMLFTEAHPGEYPVSSINNPHTNVYYVEAAMSKNGAKFYNVAGNYVGKNGKFANGMPRVSKENNAMWVDDLMYNQWGKPMVLFTSIVSPTEHNYYLGEFGSDYDWHNTLITNSNRYLGDTTIPGNYDLNYSGGIVFSRQQYGVIYGSIYNGAHFVMNKYYVQDMDHIKFLKQVSDGTEDAMRPVAVRGPYEGYDLFWMQGTYSNYQTMNTKIWGIK